MIAKQRCRKEEASAKVGIRGYSRYNDTDIHKYTQTRLKRSEFSLIYDTSGDIRKTRQVLLYSWRFHM